MLHSSCRVSMHPEFERMAAVTTPPGCKTIHAEDLLRFFTGLGVSLFCRSRVCQLFLVGVELLQSITTTPLRPAAKETRHHVLSALSEKIAL
jgi:hypothetical protein